VPSVSCSKSALRRTKSLIFAVWLGASGLFSGVARASECSNGTGLSPCFDVNTLWLPAGRATFLSMPDTRQMKPGQIDFGVASELLHRPLLVRAASPDRDGRDIHVLEYAVDASYFLSLGVLPNLEASVLSSLRVRQSGAGVGGITSQAAPPLERNAVRDPRVGLAYSLDEALAVPGIGLRLAVDATLPLGDRNPFANERSFVVMPNTTFGLRHRALELRAELGLRLRRAVDFAGFVLGNQGFLAFGAAFHVLEPGWLSVSAEAFALPPLSDSQGSAASPRVSDARLFPAEWLFGLHSSFGSRGPWTVSLAAGSGIPLSSETRDGSTGSHTIHFVGMTTPGFRSLLVVRFAAWPQP
jgi:OmpA-OmpF porin, OOP family